MLIKIERRRWVIAKRMNGLFPAFRSHVKTSGTFVIISQVNWVRLDGTSEVRLTVMKSSGIRSVFVNANHDISCVNSSASHSVSDGGTVTVLSPDVDGIVYDGALDAIRGRGNTT